MHFQVVGFILKKNQEKKSVCHLFIVGTPSCRVHFPKFHNILIITKTAFHYKLYNVGNKYLLMY